MFGVRAGCKHCTAGCDHANPGSRAHFVEKTYYTQQCQLALAFEQTVLMGCHMYASLRIVLGMLGGWLQVANMYGKQAARSLLEVGAMYGCTVVYTCVGCAQDLDECMINHYM